MPRVLIVTGEASGDLHGASLAKALQSLRPDIELVGMGGGRMRAAGVRMLHGIEGHDVVGMIGPAQLRKILRTYPVDVPRSIRSHGERTKRRKPFADGQIHCKAGHGHRRLRTEPSPNGKS